MLGLEISDYIKEGADTMKRYAFINSDGNIHSIAGWGDDRDLPSDYPIPDGCTSKEIKDDTVDMTYKYDSVNDKFILNTNLPEVHVNNTTTEDLQKQVYDLTTLLVQGGVL